MIVDKTNGKLDEAKAFAEKMGLADQLAERLDYLGNYGKGKESRCTLVTDFAPYSFIATMEFHEGGEWRHVWTGGLVFFGPKEVGAEVGDNDGWSVHT